MIEVVVATLLSGVVVVGALNVMGGAIKTRSVIATYSQGPMLANELLAEVMSQSYEDPEAPGTGELVGYGREPGETTRDTFDDVDDYFNYSESPPLDSSGQAMNEYAGWTHTVNWNFTKRDTGAFSITDSGLKFIVVQVTAPDGTLTQRLGYRWREGVLERPPAIDTEIITWVGAELQIGALGIARAGTNLINEAKD